jgi:hypothetical protein
VFDNAVSVHLTHYESQQVVDLVFGQGVGFNHKRHVNALNRIEARLTPPPKITVTNLDLSWNTAINTIVAAIIPMAA